MTGIVIASALIGIMPAVTIWMLWKRLEYKAWIEPALLEALEEAFIKIRIAFAEASSSLRMFGVSLNEANEAIIKMRIYKP